MSKNRIILKKTSCETLPKEEVPGLTGKRMGKVMVSQTSDGTSYYYKTSDPQNKLYVKCDGKEIYADLPCTVDIWIGSHGDGFYFSWKQIIFKVTFTPTNGFDISYERGELKGEEWIGENDRLVCRYGSVTRDGQIYVYLPNDDPHEGGHLLDLTEQEISTMGYLFKGLHRGVAIFILLNTRCKIPTLKKLSEKTVVIESSGSFAYLQDSCRFLYVTGSKTTLYVLDTETMQFLPPVRVNVLDYIIVITSVRDGVITMIAIEDIYYNLITAKLPMGYYEASTSTRDMGRTRIDEQFVDDSAFFSKFSNEFKISKILGDGGFGIVFEAEHSIDNWIYAVKRISVYSDEESEALHEAHSLAQLDHPGIVRYNSTWVERPPEGWQFEVDLETLKKIGALKYRGKIYYKDVFIYIQMQKCKYSLAEWLQDNQNASSRGIPRMKAWFKQMLSAVAYIHEKNLIHRDLKPRNILFADEDQLKLCDLGVATQRKIEDGTESAFTRAEGGTELYMSPEQRQRDKYSSKTDIFSLGLILAELCTVMTATDRYQIFNDYRAGKQSGLIVDSKMRDLVAFLTRVDPKLRPTCQDIIEHDI